MSPLTKLKQHSSVKGLKLPMVGVSWWWRFTPKPLASFHKLTSAWFKFVQAHSSPEIVQKTQEFRQRLRDHWKREREMKRGEGEERERERRGKKERKKGEREEKEKRRERERRKKATHPSFLSPLPGTECCHRLYASRPSVVCVCDREGEREKAKPLGTIMGYRRVNVPSLLPVSPPPILFRQIQKGIAPDQAIKRSTTNRYRW